MKPRKTVLTEQELELMKIIWQRESVTVRDVYESLLEHRKIAYTTVMTMMGILQEKGYVTKTNDAKAHVYQPAQPKQLVVTHLVSDFVERVFNLPALMIQRGQLFGRGLFLVHDGSCQAVQRFGSLDSFKTIFDHTDDHSVTSLPLVLWRSVDAAQVGTVGKTLLTRQHCVLPQPPQ